MEYFAMRQPLSGVKISAASIVLLALSVSAFGQTAQSPTSLQVPTAGAAQEDQATRRLSIDDAVQLAMEQNLGIRIQRIDPQVQDMGVAQSRSFWTPNLTASSAKSSNAQPATSVLAPAYTNGQYSGGVGLNQILPWGANYSANVTSARQTTTNVWNNYSPQLQSGLNFNYTQPLVRNFRIDQIRQQYSLSKKVRDLSDIQLRSVVVQTIRQVKNAYWDLAYSINNLAAQRTSLELAQQSLHDNQRRVQIGTMAPIDIVQAQAEVASNEQNVIVAEAQIKQAEDRLRALIFDPATPNFWTMKLEPTDTAPFDEQHMDLDGAIRNALDKRADLQQAKNSLQQSDINLKYYHNQILPDVNAQVNYGTVGYGGVQLSSVDPGAIAAGIVPARSVVTSRGYSSVLGDVFSSAYPQWSVGVQIGYPIGGSTAEANLARTRLQYQEAQLQLKNLELQVVTQVRDAARSVQTNTQRVKSAKVARELQEKKLEAEEKKMAAGMSSPFFVFQAQRDLSAARTVEIQAISDFNKSLVDFDAVQQVPLTGTGGTVVTAGTGAVQTGSSAIVRSGGD
jgi:outer membrane protein